MNAVIGTNGKALANGIRDVRLRIGLG